MGIHDAKVDNISSWWNSELFDNAEQAALCYCDVLNERIEHEMQQAHEKAAEFFSEKEIAAIVINMIVWTRLKLAQGQVPYLSE